jgi:hypothetical protein
VNIVPTDPDKSLDLLAIGRLCIDLNANEIHRPMEQTRTFTKYVGGSPVMAICTRTDGTAWNFIPAKKCW